MLRLDASSNPRPPRAPSGAQQGGASVALGDRIRAVATAALAEFSYTRVSRTLGRALLPT
jgi:hypothetical protein